MAQDNLAAALALASEYHYGQTDKAGRSYMEHICAVVADVQSPAAKVVAALHDILEDTDCRIRDLQASFPAEIVGAVRTLTRQGGEEYEAFIERVASDTLATEVKLADLRHNSQTSRIANPSDRDWERYAKYQQAISRLIKAQRDEIGEAQ